MSAPTVETVSGLDEAGYGPFLGPLVVARVRREGGRDPWRSLAEVVAGRPSAARGRPVKRLLVCDSKRVYAPGRIASLETTVLAFLGAADGGVPRSLAALERTLGASGRDTVVESLPPWHDPALPLPLDARIEVIEEAAGGLCQAAKSAGIAGVRLSARAVDAAEFNAAVRRLGTKSALLAEVATVWLADARPRERFVCDRWGGRKDYREVLAAAHGGPDRCEVREAERARGDVRYVVVRADGEVEVSFRVRAESHSFEVALASMAAKYLREVRMRAFNAWWCSRVRGLRPTAGYPVDAARWLREAEPHFGPLGVERDQVWRCR